VAFHGRADTTGKFHPQAASVGLAHQSFFRGFSRKEAKKDRKNHNPFGFSAGIKRCPPQPLRIFPTFLRLKNLQIIRCIGISGLFKRPRAVPR
jgi:hypothetical protein